MQVLNWLLDPLSWFTVCVLIALVCWHRYRVLALFFSGISLLIILIFASPWLAYPLLRSAHGLEHNPQSLPFSMINSLHRTKNPGMAILVISAGRVSMNPAFGEIDTVNGDTLSLLAYASWLHKRTELPIMLAQQNQHANATSDVVLMNQAMLSYFNVAPAWIAKTEGETKVHAPLISASHVLKQRGYHQVILISSDQMLESVGATLADMGIGVVPAAALFSAPPRREGFSRLLPDSEVLNWSRQRLQNRYLAKSDQQD